MTAGIDHVDCNAAIIIDADLQDPPELISELLQKWSEGYDVVYARRLTRSGGTWFKKLSAHIFHRLMERIGDRVQIPRDTGDFRLMNRRSLDALRQLEERHRFMKGLFAWIGFRQAAVTYHRHARHSSVSRCSYFRLVNLSIEGITPFITAPLKVATYLGLLVAFLAFVCVMVAVYRTLVYGVQLLAIGIIGEYLGRVFNETKHRPLYLVQDYYAGGYLPLDLTEPAAAIRID